MHRADQVAAAFCQASTQLHTPSQQQLINEIFDQKINKITETLQMLAARIQLPPSQYEFKPNAYSSRPTFNRKSNYRYEQNYRPTQTLLTGPNNHIGPSKITNRLNRIIIYSKNFQKTCKFGIVGRRCRNEIEYRPTVHYSWSSKQYNFCSGDWIRRKYCH